MNDGRWHHVYDSKELSFTEAMYVGPAVLVRVANQFTTSLAVVQGAKLVEDEEHENHVIIDSNERD